MKIIKAHIIPSIFSIIFFLYPTLASAQFELVIEPEGHISQITEVLVTNNQSNIITVSKDKTIRVWDWKHQKLIKTYRGNGGLNQGEYYCAAITPDDKYLAVGGQLANKDALPGRIKIIDLKSDKQIRTLNLTKYPVFSLVFSKNGNFLACGDSEGGVKIWDFKSILQNKDELSPIGILGGHEKGVYGLEFSTDSQILATSSIDGVINVWETSFEPFLLLDQQRDKNISIRSVAISPSGTHIITGDIRNNLVTLRNIYGEKIQDIDNLPHPISSIKFTENEKYLIVSTMFGYIHVYSFPNCKLINTIKEFDNTVSAMAVTRLIYKGKKIDIIIAAGGNNDDILLWDINENKRFRKFSGISQAIVSVGFKNDTTILFGNEYEADFIEKNYNYKGPFKYSFSLKTLELNNFSDLDIQKTYEPTINKFEDTELILHNLKELKIGYKGSLMLNDNSQLFRAFSFNERGNIIVGSSFKLQEYKINRQLYKKYIGHIGEVTGIAVNKNFLISGSTDHTLRIWKMDTSGKRSISLDKFKELALKNYLGSEENYQKALDEENMTVNEHYEREIILSTYPIVNFFFTKKKNWICWNKDFYFTCSRGGNKYVGFQKDNGANSLSDFYPFEQFDLKFNRPDIILSDLGFASKEKVLSYTKAYQKRLKKLNFTENMLTDDFHVPEIKINTLNLPINTTNQELNFQIEATDTKQNLDRLNIWINDVPIYGINGINLRSKNVQFWEQNLNLRLSKGENKIQISTMNQGGAESLKETIYVTYNAPSSKPNLYLIGIAANDFPNDDLDLKYPLKDIDNFFKLYQNQSDKYEKVVIKKLYNNEISNKGLSKIKTILNQSKVDDQVILFVAGHGVLDDSLDYYLGTPQMDFNNPQNGGILYEDLENLLDGIPARQKLFLMDACHSGEIDKEETEIVQKDLSTPIPNQNGKIIFRSHSSDKVPQTKSLGLDNSFELMKQLFVDLRRGTGATVISSAGGGEFALEGDEWQNSVFTYCLLTGLKDKKADTNNDGQVLVSELRDYLQREVPRLTGNHQQPTMRMENISNDWRVW